MEKKARRTLAAQSEEKKSLADLVADFIRKYRKVMFIVLGAVAAVILVILVWNGISTSRTHAASSALESVETAYSTWQGEKDQVKKDALVPDLQKKLDDLVAKWSGTFQAQEGLAMKARLAETTKDYAKAEEFWASAAKMRPTSYLASVALQGAATDAEERGDIAKAIEYYTTMISGKSTKAVGLAHARFSLGRLQEASKDYTAARKVYEELVAAHPDSDWAVLARDRMIFIDAGKLAK